MTYQQKRDNARKVLLLAHGIVDYDKEHFRSADAIFDKQINELVKSVIGEDERGEVVQVSCPDLNEGCLVMHTDFKMTHNIKTRNELRAEQVKRMEK